MIFAAMFVARYDFLSFLSAKFSVCLFHFFFFSMVLAICLVAEENRKSGSGRLCGMRDPIGYLECMQLFLSHSSSICFLSDKLRS
jgi:hypothetical protein